MADGAMNQSMDDILAQIRKIISEEPGADAKSGAAVVAPAVRPAPIATPPPPPPAASAPAPIAPVTVATLAAPPHAAVPARVPISVAPVVDDLSDLLEDDATPAGGTPVFDTAAAPAPSAIPTAADPIADLIDAAPAEVAKVVAVAAETATPTAAVAPPVVAAPPISPEPPSAPAVSLSAQPERSPEIQPIETQPVVAAAPTPPVEPAPPVGPLPVAAAVVPPVAVAAAVVAPPVSLSTLFSNRIDATPSGRSGLLVPSHIGRPIEAKAAEPAPTAPPPPSVDAPVARPVEPLAPLTAAPLGGPPLGGALGALAAGLAASGLTPQPAQPVVEAPPPAKAIAIEPIAASKPEPELTTDQLMAAIRPVLKDWLDGNMPRILDGALRDALPDLIARAKVQACKS